MILPIFILILFSVIDFGIIFNEKSSLENDSVDIINLFKNGSSLDEIEDLYKDNNINVSSDGEYYKFIISTSINLITPGLNRILGDPYVIDVERVVPYD